jgi:DNA ligase (NAD+)
LDKELIVKQLKVAQEFYYKGTPIMTDPEFDELESKLRSVDPTNTYFSQVGAPIVRGTKVRHTIPMGSLDQVSDLDEAFSWIQNTGATDIVLSDKLDGNSIAIYYDEDGEFESAVTRGDGIEGLDVTRHIQRMFNLHGTDGAQVPYRIDADVRPRVVRAEVIMNPELFKKYVSGYKNPRNYVAGQLNRSVADPEFIENVSIIVFDSDLPDHFKGSMLAWLDQLNFDVVNYETISAESVMQFDLEQYLTTRKKKSRYELDGIVLDVNDVKIRKALGFNHLNPNFACKFKINVNFVETEVVRVEWNPSKDGYMKPRVQFEPVDLAGVTISFATGFNAKFIVDNSIGPGAIIKVTRSGDVIPKIEQVITPAVAPSLPVGFEDNCIWSDTITDLILKEKPDESYVKEIMEFFTGIDAPVLKMGNVTALYNAGFTTIQSIIKMTEDEMVVVLGENGFKAYSGLREKLSSIPEYVLTGSLPFFGRGMGKRKMKVLAETHGSISNLTHEQIINTQGFDAISAKKVADAIPIYVAFLTDLADYVGKEDYVKRTGALSGIVVCFTGVRSKELENVIESQGGKVASSITSDVTHLVARDTNGKSGKLEKARKNGIQLLSLEDAEALWG